VVLLASNYDKSRFFKADDLDGDRKLRIKGVTEELVGAGAEKEKKLVVWFTNDERGLVLNRLNNRTLRGAFGDDTVGWAGKVIIIFAMMVEMRGKMVPGLRVRIPPPKHGGAEVTIKPKPSSNGQTVAAKPKPPVDDELDDIDAPPTQLQTTDADELDDGIPF
jgi:hypothetical protein